MALGRMNTSFSYRGKAYRDWDTPATIFMVGNRNFILGTVDACIACIAFKGWLEVWTIRLKPLWNGHRRRPRPAWTRAGGRGRPERVRTCRPRPGSPCGS